MSVPRESGLFRGVCASTVTTSDGHGRLSLQRLKPHIDWLIADGADAISPLGSTGEFFAHETADRKRVLEGAIDACDGRVPVIAGTHHYSTRLTVGLSKHAERAGADALLIVPPYYARPTIGQVKDHYRRVAEAVSIPIVLYHNVAGTSIDLQTADLIELFEEGAIAGVKMSNREPDRICELLQGTEGRLAVYAGLDLVAFEGLCHGAHGWISGIPSTVPGAARRLYDAIAVRGDLDDARRQWERLAPLMRMLFGAFIHGGEGPQWLSVMYAALNLVGPAVGDPQRPVLPLGSEHRDRLRSILRDLGYAVARG